MLYNPLFVKFECGPGGVSSPLGMCLDFAACTDSTCSQCKYSQCIEHILFVRFDVI